MRLINNEKRIRREVIKQRRRRFALLSPRQIARVILDTTAIAQLFNHFEIKTSPLFQALRFHEFVVRLK